MTPMRCGRLILWVAVLAGAMSRTVCADTVTLNDGTSLEGTIVIETETKVVLKLAEGTKAIRRAEIASITKSPREEVAPPEAAPAAEPSSAVRSQKFDMFKPAGTDADPISKMVIRVYATLEGPDFLKPWTRLAPRPKMSSGVYEGIGRVLTTAEAVLYAGDLQIQIGETGERLAASVTAIDLELNLALLQIKNEPLASRRNGLPVSDTVPAVRSAFSEYGFTSEVSNVSLTSGTIDHIGFGQPGGLCLGLYLWPTTKFESGASGGPVIGPDNLLIGLGCQTPSGSFIIPWLEIEGFMQRMKQSGAVPKPRVNQHFVPLVNQSLRAYLNVPPSVHGMLVAKADGPSGTDPFFDWDIVTAIGEAPVDNQGFVTRSDGMRFTYGFAVDAALTTNTVFTRTVDGQEQTLGTLTGQSEAGKEGRVPFKVIRSGKEISLGVPLGPTDETVVIDLGAGYPSYFILGPVVFSTVSKQLLAVIDRLPGLAGILSHRGSPIILRRADRPAFTGEELVLVSSPFFPHKLAEGYADPTFCVVKTVNGVAIRNLLHLVEVLRDSKDEFIDIEFADRIADRLVFPRAEMIRATESILSDNDVRSQGSADAIAVWKSGGGVR